jgi:hypothetical protein
LESCPWGLVPLSGGQFGVATVVPTIGGPKIMLVGDDSTTTTNIRVWRMVFGGGV